jgi:IS30 family transposase
MHDHDRKWIDEQINKLPSRIHAQVRRKYAEAYMEAHNAEPVEHRKDGRARFAANTRLREFVTNFTKNT